MYLICFRCIIYVILIFLYDIRDYVIFYSYGLRIRQFFKDYKVVGSYKGESMSGKVIEDNFYIMKFKLLVERILIGKEVY